MPTNAAFKQRMDALLDPPGGFEVAGRHVSDYWYDEPFTGSRFDSMADQAQPNRITERDLVAVTMLGVKVPAPVAIWMLSPDGSSEIESLLASVPADADLWSHPHLLDEGSDLWRLWRLLRTGCWPERKRGNGMGQTITSKILAAKRPALVPVYDSVIRDLLGPVEDYWQAYRFALDDEARLKWAIATGKAPEDVPLLRRIDALLWMFGTRGGGT